MRRSLKWAFVASGVIFLAAFVLSLRMLLGGIEGEFPFGPLLVIVLWALAGLAMGVVLLLSELPRAIRGLFLTGRKERR